MRSDPPVVSLGVVSHREPLTAKAALTLRPPITDVRVLPHPDWQVTLKAMGDGTRELVATPTKPGVPRAVNDTLQLVPVGSDGHDRPTRPLLIQGEVKGDVVASPADISLGRVKIGDSVEESVRITSLTKRRFEIGRVDGDATEVTAATDPADGTQLRIRVKVKEGGEQVRWVTVAVKGDDGRTGEVRIPVRYFGE